ncbi:Lrp/AsnC family transcriptional regulator [Amphritea sp. HPY]|uniref:Lrp/AsnC family transcriptional regulator n=1 Tax=Amphritea sp. HPY TaxID=3421652 RepID=UPI003D7E3F68
MDGFDQKIIVALRQNARQSVSAIAEQVNLSRSAVSERIKRMEEQGDILGYQVLTPSGTDTSNAVKAYFEIRQRGYQCSSIAEVLLQHPEVKHCHGTSGEVDLLVYLELPHMQRLHDIRHDLDSQLPDSVKVTTHIVMQEWQGA